MSHSRDDVATVATAQYRVSPRVLRQHPFQEYPKSFKSVESRSGRVSAGAGTLPFSCFQGKREVNENPCPAPLSLGGSFHKTKETKHPLGKHWISTQHITTRLCERTHERLKIIPTPSSRIPGTLHGLGRTLLRITGGRRATHDPFSCSRSPISTFASYQSFWR